jgi:deoxyribonuclease V
MADKMVCEGDVGEVHYVAGFDVSVNRRDEATAAVVILEYPGLTVIEKVQVSGITKFPYIPGLLSFREMPLLLKAFEKTKTIPDLIMVDGQGIAHPRRFGLATHMGLYLNIPTIGYAKSLFGEYTAPAVSCGSWSYLVDPHDSLPIGAVVRTKTAVKPLYISVGHKLSLSSAIHWVLQCCKGYKLPEPTRLAHLASREKCI